MKIRVDSELTMLRDVTKSDQQ